MQFWLNWTLRRSPSLNQMTRQAGWMLALIIETLASITTASLKSPLPEIQLELTHCGIFQPGTTTHQNHLHPNHMPWQAPSTSTALLMKSIAALKWVSCHTVLLVALFCCSSSIKSRWIRCGVKVFYRLSFISTQDYINYASICPKRWHCWWNSTRIPAQASLIHTNNHYDMRYSNCFMYYI